MDRADHPRALCHEDEVQRLVDAWEAKHATPVGETEMEEFMAAVHFDHEDCPCDCCQSA